MGDHQCNGLRILNDNYVFYDANGNDLLESDEIDRIPPAEQTMDLFVGTDEFPWQADPDIVCNFLSLSFLSKLRFARGGSLEQLSSFNDILRSSGQEEAVKFTDFMSSDRQNFSERSLVDTLLRSANLTFSRAPDEQGLLDRILQDLPQILAVGEAHALASDRVTTAQLFADRVLPLLMNRYGYDMIVLEALPSDQPSSEIEHYIEHGVADDEHTPFLSANLRLLKGKSAEDLLSVIKRCGELGISVRGGGPSLQDIIAGDMPSLNFEIRDRSITAIKSALRSTDRVVWYGGLIHNDIDDGQELSIAPVLSSTYSFVELDLIAPYGGDGRIYDYIDYVSAEELSTFSCDNDLVCIMVNPNSYVFVYPPAVLETF